MAKVGVPTKERTGKLRRVEILGDEKHNMELGTVDNKG